MRWNDYLVSLMDEGDVIFGEGIHPGRLGHGVNELHFHLLASASNGVLLGSDSSGDEQH